MTLHSYRCNIRFQNSEQPFYETLQSEVKIDICKSSFESVFYFGTGSLYVHFDNVRRLTYFVWKLRTEPFAS